RRVGVGAEEHVGEPLIIVFHHAGRGVHVHGSLTFSPPECATIRALPRLAHAPLPRPSTRRPTRARGPGRAAPWPDLIHHPDTVPRASSLPGALPGGTCATPS